MKILAKTLILLTGLLIGAQVIAATPETRNGITTINIDEYNGYFAVKETLASLKPGKYKFVVTNKAKKLVGFLIQDGKTHKQLDVFPVEPGKTKTTVLQISENGFRYRCPINPTPWIDVNVSK
jgi:outer membrane protein assembly factor BamE (lipoprotein component of BamABCDE complex)